MEVTQRLTFVWVKLRFKLTGMIISRDGGTVEGGSLPSPAINKMSQPSSASFYKCKASTFQQSKEIFKSKAKNAG